MRMTSTSTPNPHFSHYIGNTFTLFNDCGEHFFTVPDIHFKLVPKEGFEPPRLSPEDFESSVSANSTTWA